MCLDACKESSKTQSWLRKEMLMDLFFCKLLPLPSLAITWLEIKQVPGLPPDSAGFSVFLVSELSKT